MNRELYEKLQDYYYDEYEENIDTFDYVGQYGGFHFVFVHLDSSNRGRKSELIRIKDTDNGFEVFVHNVL